MAAVGGSVKSVNFLLDKRAKMFEGDFSGNTPLHFVCASGIADCVHLLARRGADFSGVDDNGRGCL